MKHFLVTIAAVLLLSVSCTRMPSSYRQIDTAPSIFPDYTDVVIPSNIAPLNFSIEEQGDEFVTVITGGSEKVMIGGDKVRISPRKWEKLKKRGLIGVTVMVKRDKSWFEYKPFTMTVADEIDPYISYRIIPVAVETYEKLSIWERNLTNFKKKVMFANTMVETNASGTCINCHTYRNYSTDNMLFHVRQYKGGTIMVLDGQLHKINMKTDSTISAGVYPDWHPTQDPPVGARRHS